MFQFLVVSFASKNNQSCSLIYMTKNIINYLLVAKRQDLQDQENISLVCMHQ